MLEKNVCRLLILLLATTRDICEARKWQDVIDQSIFLQPNLDQNRYRLKIELDPFFGPEEPPVVEPTPQPVSSAWMTRSPAPTDAPSSIPSDSPSLAPTGPTMSPTTRAMNVEGNGGCHEGAVLYRVNMYDLWGDGWDSSTKVTITGIEDQDSTQVSGSTITKTHTTTRGDTTVSITSTIELTADHPFGTGSVEGGNTFVSPLGQIFQGNLHTGSHGQAYVCLVPRRCYEVVARGGDYLDEVSWDIEVVNLGGESTVVPTTVVEGGAPNDCSFSIPDDDGEIFCESTCSQTLNPQHTQTPAVSHLTPVEGSDQQEETLTFTTRSYDSTQAKKNGENLLYHIRNGGNA